jgi:uncharacterized protein DUF5615
VRPGRRDAPLGPNQGMDRGVPQAERIAPIYVRAARRGIVSKDADFSDRVLLSPDGPNVIHIRVGNLTMAEFHRYLTSVWAEVCRASDACRLVRSTETASRALSREAPG